jgi:hypothetical protein
MLLPAATVSSGDPDPDAEVILSPSRHDRGPVRSLPVLCASSFRSWFPAKASRISP